MSIIKKFLKFFFLYKKVHYKKSVIKKVLGEKCYEKNYYKNSVIKKLLIHILGP